jgi:LacI family transcriptional regulator
MMSVLMKRFTKTIPRKTIRDVANHAGVSVATASYALNESGHISVETRKRVLKAAEDLMYTPSIAARLLKGVKGNLIAILTDGLAGPWYGEFLEGIQTTLNAGGFAVAAMTIQSDSLLLCRNLASAEFIRGLVVLNPAKSLAQSIAPLVEHMPTVVFDPGGNYGRAIKYVLNNRGGIAALMGHLWERGYRDYLWLDGDLEAAWDAEERFAAFQDFLDERGLPRDRRLRTVGGFRTEVAERAVAAILGQGHRPRAVVAANDESAIGALNAIRRFGLKVPEDMAVAGFDGLDISAWMQPALTTLKFDRRALGQEMARRMMSEISGVASGERIITVPLELIVGGST